MGSIPNLDDLLKELELLARFDVPDPSLSDDSGNSSSAANGPWDARIYQIILSLGAVTDVKAAQDLANQLEAMCISFDPEEQPVIASFVRIRDMMQPEESAEKAKSTPEMRTYDAQGSVKPVAGGHIVAECC